jgi:hypothetical protein
MALLVLLGISKLFLRNRERRSNNKKNTTTIISEEKREFRENFIKY